MDNDFTFSAVQSQSVPPSGMGGRRKRSKLVWLFMLLVIFTIGNILFGLYSSLDRKGVFSGPRLGIIKLEGMITDAEPVVRWAEELRTNPSVRGVLLRVESGGGAVVPSQEIYAAIKRLSAVKPVVTSMGGAAASGGYYAAVGAPYIVANPATLTGSIGVKMQMTNLSVLMDKVGVSAPVMASGALKDAGSPYRAMSEEERVYLEGLVQDIYAGFVQDVATGRNLPLEVVKKLADGRAYTGRQALELKLVDALGDQDFALRELAKRSGMRDLPDEILEGPAEEEAFLDSLLRLGLNFLMNGKLENSLREARHDLPYRFYF